MHLQMDGVTIVQQAMKSIMDEDLSVSEASVILDLLSRDLEKNLHDCIKLSINDWIDRSSNHISWLIENNFKGKRSIDINKNEEATIRISVGGAILSQ